MRNRFDLSELAGAFGNLGTLIPFVVAHVSVLLGIGIVVARVQQPALLDDPALIKPALRLPELALSGRDSGGEMVDRFVILGTAAFAVLNVGVAVVFGIAAHHAARKGWLTL